MSCVVLCAQHTCMKKHTGERLNRQSGYNVITKIKLLLLHEKFSWEPEMKSYISCAPIKFYTNPSACSVCTSRVSGELIPQRDLISSSWAVDPGSRQTHMVPSQAYCQDNTLELQGKNRINKQLKNPLNRKEWLAINLSLQKECTVNFQKQNYVCCWVKFQIYGLYLDIWVQE